MASVVQVKSDWKSTAIIAGVAIVGIGIVIYIAYKGISGLSKPVSDFTNWVSQGVSSIEKGFGSLTQSSPLSALVFGGPLGGLISEFNLYSKLFGQGSKSSTPTYASNAQAMYTALKPSQQWYTSLAQQYGGSTGITYSLPNYPGINFYMSPAQEFMA